MGGERAIAQPKRMSATRSCGFHVQAPEFGLVALPQGLVMEIDPELKLISHKVGQEWRQLLILEKD